MKISLARTAAALLIAGATTFAPAFAQTYGTPPNATVESGTNVYGTMQTALSSKSSHIGDPFAMTVTEPYPVGYDFTGATILGHVSNVIPAGQGRKPTLALAFDQIRYSDGTTVPFTANLGSLQEKTRSKNALAVAGKTLAGLLVGNAIGKTIFHTGGGGAVGAIGGFIYGINAQADVDVNPGAQAQLTLVRPLQARRQAQ